MRNYIMKYRVETVKGFFEDEVDVLIILDACRYDYFALCNDIKGELLKLYLKCESTLSWFNKTWQEYRDAVYISANPNINSREIGHLHYAKNLFKKIIDVWDFGWDEKLGTVPPETVTEVAKNFMDENLVVHYIQPHAPYIGEPKLDISSWRGARCKFLKLPFKGKDRTQEFLAQRNFELLRRAYRGNLERVLQSVKKLLQVIPKDKRIAVTSDHSELLGDKEYGHGYPQNMEIPVPYLKVRVGN